MKERFKTFLLLSLVSISIIITQKLWIQMPNQIFGLFDEPLEVTSPYVLSDMIAPNKYLLNFNSKNHTLVYDDSKYGMWLTSRKSLVALLSSKNITIDDISNEEYLDYQNKKSVVFYFPEEVNTYILTKAWDIKKPNSIVDTMPNIDSIYIYLGSGDPFFIFTDGEKRVAIRDSSIDVQRLRAEINKIEDKKGYIYYYSMSETLGTQNDIFIPYSIDNSLPEIYVANEVALLDYGEKDKLAEKFFNKSIDYIRGIVESNGSSIYVYNQRVLKLNINGTIEYFNALDEPVKERNLYKSLLSAANFISEKTGVQKGMYLAKIEDIQSDNSFGYRFTFRYRVRGIPVILGNQEVEEYVKMEVFNNHIRSYKYYARKDMNKFPRKIIENKNMISAFDAIDKNYELLEEWYLSDNNIEKESEDASLVNEILSSIEDITLAYFDPCLKDKDEKLIAVWVINFNGRLLAFDAYNGILVYER
ncbi:hypothetical protein ACTNDY_06195 [Tissierellaceae bacterium HCP3S3_D8]